VAFARAISGNPSIILADEPTGNLDSKNAQVVMSLLDRLHDQGATICMVTHDPRSAARAYRTIELSNYRSVRWKNSLGSINQKVPSSCFINKPALDFLNRRNYYVCLSRH
jgi:ABC-type lipoprotein export system ATPase subunit